jgi:phosphoribosylaminoimidazole-succinocarboxamide synthase
LFTPSTKAPAGQHDENISYAEAEKIVGVDIARQVRDAAINLYTQAALYAADRGIIIADTKFEFGLDEHGTVHLIDEILTPDSSRFWPMPSYRVGISPPSFDKQFVRDWLETQAWNKKAPAPHLPLAVAQQTADKYEEALRLLTQDTQDV